MPYLRFLALFACFSLPLCFVQTALAGQVAGQLGVSLTILKHCEVAGEQDGQSLTLHQRGCDTSAFQLRNEQGQPLLDQTSDSDSTSLIKPSAADGPRVVVYW